ncbi:helix-turn-helix domain-containing protein [Pedobacter sp. Leaf176]|uniref:helix-turn-helix domain-containing protein n=1 Tax=Pedobacter sp. Leaf176 TaxID=1736286 RepID=UPI0006F96673|nr:helix-turn-helix domain-containing protein [Pedobacter sp. Leaf176]KQR67720.1 hypothetical protein ASF92_18795 [Pedobacter sp. Leaf176]
MTFTRLEPDPSISHLIECYWMMQSENRTPKIEKIIPDGFTELIFNYRDVYKAKTDGNWYLQSPNLLAGQISSYFYLENTGLTGSCAIKLKPAALTQLYGLNMELYLDKIVDLDTIPNAIFSGLKNIVLPFQGIAQLKMTLDNHFIQLSKAAGQNPLEQVLELVFNSNGMSPVSELVATAGVSERQLERLFKKYVGLSPKYYSRIIKFNYIFELIKSGKNSWTEIIYKSGYYDQSHFIRNFKAFTGEDPSSYFFEEANMANFFLMKKS